MIKFNKYMIEPTETDGIKKTFYDLYNDILEGRYKYTTNQTLQRELERFRNNMAVDFYNLLMELGDKDGTITTEDWLRCGDQFADFANKYILYSQIGEKPIEMFGEPVDAGVFFLLTFAKISDFLLRFKTITDKVLMKDRLAEDELQILNNWLCGKIAQNERNSGGYVLAREYVTFQNFGMIRALYEWVFLLSIDLVDVGRCEAPKCNKLFVPEPRGKDQKYCSDACRKRAFRSREAKAVAQI